MKEKEAWKGRHVGHDGKDAAWAAVPRGWFVAIGMVLLAMLSAPLFLMKLWSVTPDGFAPVIRISVLDRVQAKMLGRSAAKHFAAGRLKEAGLSWREAIANNPVDVAVIREWTRAAISSGGRFARDGIVPWNESLWMLRLGGTNDTDLDLVVRLFGRMGNDEAVLELGSQRFAGLGAAGAGDVLKATFRSGDMKTFDAMWAKRGKDLESDAELALYRAAWKAQWGPAGTASEGRQMLQSARDNPGLRVAALSLSRLIARERLDVDEHSRLLGLLSDEGAATVDDHVDHWRLLASLGRLDEARRLAGSATLPVVRLQDARSLGEAFFGLGMTEQAIAVAENLPGGMAPDERLVWLRARCLYELKRWDDLRALGLLVRNNPRMGPGMVGCAHALEAIASKNLNRLEPASDSARMAAATTNGPPRIVMPLAMKLSAAGFPAEGLAMLKGVASGLEDSKDYWQQRMAMAGAAGDTADFKLATAAILKMDPENSGAANNYAVALLLAREALPEALRITFANHTKYPGAVGFAINHAMALTLNNRPDDAARLLVTIPVSKLAPGDAANYRVAWFDIMARRRDWDGARKQLEGVDLTSLLPAQQARIAAELKDFPPP